MNKNKHLNRWLWKWHIIAGLITLPVMLLLAVTGIIYLFKDTFEEVAHRHIIDVEAQNVVPIPFAEQLKAAQAVAGKKVNKLIVPEDPNKATEFVSGMRAQKRSVYVNPYTGQVTGDVVLTDTFMYTIRNLHGELLTGKIGTYTVELVSSWFIVLILTGLYVWWPSGKFSPAGFFTIRINKGKRIFYRDVHSVTGFWLSVFMLILLAGGMPWTDVFGSSLKWVQKQTDTGYPSTWSKPRGIKSNNVGGDPLSLDEIVKVAGQLPLEGRVTVMLPSSPEGVFKVSNRSFFLSDQKVIYLDQYTAEVLKTHTWSDVGVLMDMRQVFMRLHQGEYGFVNWLIVLIVALFFTLSTVAGLVSYLLRKPAGRWGLPEVPASFKVETALVAMICILGLIFPLFGASALLIWLCDFYGGRSTREATS